MALRVNVVWVSFNWKIKYYLFHDDLEAGDLFLVQIEVSNQASGTNVCIFFGCRQWDKGLASGANWTMLTPRRSVY